MISAGEASGDAHAAHALEALQKTQPDVTTFGMGAAHLESAGTELIVDCRDLAVIGFVDVVLNYHRFLRRLKTLRVAMEERRPDLLVLVDFPDFNLKLAETAKALNIPVLFYVSPQIWAWRPKRIHRIGRLVTHMAVLFPFEVPYYERENIPVTYTGNPLVDDVVCDLSPAQAKEKLGLDAHSKTVALLPGSRPGELSRHLPVMLDAAQQLAQTQSPIQFVLPRAPTLPAQDVNELIGDHACHPHVVAGEAHTAMRAADVVICASGTATLETVLIGTPMILIYRLNRLNYELMRRLIQIPYVGLVNIVAGRRIVPELIQHDANPDSICAATTDLLTNEEASEQQRLAFEEVRKKLGAGGASDRIAELIHKLLSPSCHDNANQLSEKQKSEN